jgi:hypothetical protein
MNGKMVGTKPLYVALAQRKEERRARLQVSALNSQIFFLYEALDGRLFACDS